MATVSAGFLSARQAPPPHHDLQNHSRTPNARPYGPEDIQTLIYSTGKENGYSKNLRDWFKLIYEVVFGDQNGPRMGFFISFFGVQETKDLIQKRVK